MKRASWLLVFGLFGPFGPWVGCKDEVPTPMEIPSEVHGRFGRNEDDLHHGTRGLEVDGTSMRFSEMTMVVTDGKMVGDTFQIDRAEVRWKKDDPEKLPKECKGTLARQGDRLLVTLFKKDSDEPCESILKGEWSEWKEVTEMPAWLQGTYGSSDPYADEASATIDAKGITGAGAAPVVLESAYHFVGKQDLLFVTASKYDGASCIGPISLHDGEMTAALKVEAETEGGTWCPMFGGTRWEVEASKLPKSSLTNGKVTATFDGDGVTLTNADTPALTCTQKVVRTSTRSTTDKSMDNLTVLAGVVLTLAPATPRGGKESCEKRMRNLMQQRCRELGIECEDDAGEVAVQCPTHVVVGDPTGPGRKIALLPNDVQTVACYDTTGDFKGT